MAGQMPAFEMLPEHVLTEMLAVGANPELGEDLTPLIGIFSEYVVGPASCGQAVITFLWGAARTIVEHALAGEQVSPEDGENIYVIGVADDAARDTPVFEATQILSALLNGDYETFAALLWASMGKGQEWAQDVLISSVSIYNRAVLGALKKEAGIPQDEPEDTDKIIGNVQVPGAESIGHWWV
jgi:hypothetical protein